MQNIAHPKGSQFIGDGNCLYINQDRYDGQCAWSMTMTPYRNVSLRNCRWHVNVLGGWRGSTSFWTPTQHTGLHAILGMRKRSKKRQALSICCATISRDSEEVPQVESRPPTICLCRYWWSFIFLLLIIPLNNKPLPIVTYTIYSIKLVPRAFD